MTIELITGKAGEAHVDSDDVGNFNAYTLGEDNYILNGCAVSMSDSNTFHIAAGNLLLNGRHVRITGTGEDVTVESGTSSTNRRDIIVYHYEVGDDDVETGTLEVVKGTAVASSSTPSDPSMPTSTTILGGGTDVYIKIARVTFSGLTPACTSLLSSFTSNEALVEVCDGLQDSIDELDDEGAHVIWNRSGGLYMSESHTATLSETVASQRHGVILHWCYYADSETKWSRNQYVVVPKTHISYASNHTDPDGNSTYSVTCLLTNGGGSRIGSKYVGVRNSSITGNSNNNATAAKKSNSNVIISSRYYVLVEVLGF